MAKKRISDVLIEVLANAGIERIYGITGDSLNSVNDSLRRNGDVYKRQVLYTSVMTSTYCQQRIVSEQ